MQQLLDTKDLMGLVSVIIPLFGYGIYLRSVLRGQTKPHLFSWIVWTLSTGIMFVAQWQGGAEAGCWVTGMTTVLCGLVAGYAFLRGEKNITRSDWVALYGALMIIPVWWITKNVLWAVILSVVIEVMAFFPTFRKSWSKPWEENSILYMLEVLKWTIAFFALGHYSPATVIYPSSLVITNMAFVLMIMGRRKILAKTQVLAILIAGLMVFSYPAMAQTPDLSVYSVTDVAVDVTADSAAHARDQAVSVAQRQALTQLLDRLSVKNSLVDKLKDDDLSTLVQNFEVQNERASSVRYIGNFRVQFRPNAVRKLLTSHGVAVADTPSKPYLVLPIMSVNGHPVLWEQSTRWRTAWDKAPHDDGLVPVLVPNGGLEDVAILSTAEAISGKPESLKALITKYQAGGAAVVALSGNPDDPAANLSVDLTRYDTEGVAAATEHLALSDGATPTSDDEAMKNLIGRVRKSLESSWKAEAHQAAAGAQDQSLAASSGAGFPAQMADMPTLHVPVTVPIATLAEWAQIRRKLASVIGVSRIDVLALQRGAASIEIEWHASIADLQSELQQKQLNLTQDATTHAWVLRPL